MPSAGDIIRASDVPAEAYTDYTPTLGGGWLIGNGTITGTYMQVGDQVHVYIKCTVGSTTTKSGTPTFTLPVAAAIASNTDAYGFAQMFDTSATAARMGVVAGLNNATVRIYGADGTVTAPTVPWTWATGDTFALNMTYEAA